MTQKPTAMITGAASGIGKATASLFASKGFDLCLIDRDGRALVQAKIDLEPTGSLVELVQVDVVDVDQLSEQITAVISRTRIDVLVNNAGTAVAASVADTSREDWDRIFNVNVGAIFEISRLMVPHMRSNGGGSIVNIASVAGLVGLEARAAYCASKGAVIALTRAMAVDHARENIRVNAVCPGTVMTGWIDEILSGNPEPHEARRRMEERQIVGRLGEPSEVAAAVYFLAENKFATGSALVIDGGLTAR